MSEVLTPCILAEVDLITDEDGADMQIKPAMVRHVEWRVGLPQYGNPGNAPVDIVRTDP